MQKLVPNDAILIPDNAKRVFNGVVFDVFQWQQEQFDDSLRTFEMLKRADSVTALAIVDDKLLAIDEDQSHRGQKITFPSGRVSESDTSTLEAIKRELLEETGYQFSNYRLINVFQPQTKIEWFVHAYVAWGVRSVSDANPDSGEHIKPRLVDFTEARQIVENDVVYLAEVHRVFSICKDTQDIKNLPEFHGQTVDR